MNWSKREETEALLLTAARG